MARVLSRRQGLRTGAALAAAAAWPMSAAAQPALPQPASGRLERLSGLPWRHLPERPVDLWLPEGHDPDRPHALLLMLDGQMAFDPRSTWNRQAWRADQAVAALQGQGRLGDTVIVAVHNRPEHRFAEYFPEPALAELPAPLREDYTRRAQHGRALGEAHVRTLVDEVIPIVARRCALHGTPARTAVCGSSMGGLAAWATLCRAPDTFGAAIAFSTHWIGIPPAWRAEADAAPRAGATAQALLRVFERSLPAPGRHRLWIDRGDDALDRLYAPHLDAAAAALRRRGWGPELAVVRNFAGTGHDEASWAGRLQEALGFVWG